MVALLGVAALLRYWSLRQGPRLAADDQYVWVRLSRPMRGLRPVQVRWSDITGIRRADAKDSHQRYLRLEVGRLDRTDLQRHHDIGEYTQPGAMHGPALIVEESALRGRLDDVLAGLHHHAPAHVEFDDPAVRESR